MIKQEKGRQLNLAASSLEIFQDGSVQMKNVRAEKLLRFRQAFRADQTFCVAVLALNQNALFRHRDGILSWYDFHITNGKLEAPTTKSRQ